MKIKLNNRVNKSAIKSIRSQITDKGSLKDFDSFIAKHDAFDFNNDEHINALRKISFHSTCNVDSKSIKVESIKGEK